MKLPLLSFTPRLLSRRELLEIIPLAAAGTIIGCSPEQSLVPASTTHTSTGTTPPSTTPPPVTMPTAPAVSPFDSTQIGFGINHYLVTGQSLATGEQGFFGISNIQPFQNLMLGPSSDFNYPTIAATTVIATPMVSGPQVRETIGNGFADSLTSQAETILAAFPGGPASYRSMVTCSGVPGDVYQQICGPSDWNAGNPYWATGGAGSAGSPSFQEMMSQVSWGMKLAREMGVTYRVAAMLLLHGEFDGLNPEYPADLRTWQSDMQVGVHALTGQTETIPMIAGQTQSIFSTSSFNIGGGFGLYLAALSEPDKIYVACPEYAVKHHLATETGPFPGYPVHPTADGYRHLGQMMAKAAKAVTMEGQASWQPLMPITLVRIAKQIIIGYHVPVGPLVFDTDWVTDPGNYGFRYVDSVDSTVAIASVAITAPGTVTLTFNKIPNGGTLGYADFAPPSDPSWTSGGDGNSTDFGPTFGPRGCLRDSDPAVAYYTPSVPYYTPSAGGSNHYPMQNYCVAWQTAI